MRGVSGLSQEGWGCWGCSRTQGRPLGSKDVLGLGLPGASPMWPHRPALPGGQLQSSASVSPPSGQGWPSSPNPAPLSLYYYPRASLGPVAASPPAMPSSQVGRVSWAWCQAPRLSGSHQPPTQTRAGAATRLPSRVPLSSGQLWRKQGQSSPGGATLGTVGPGTPNWCPCPQPCSGGAGLAISKKIIEEGATNGSGAVAGVARRYSGHRS